MFQWFSSSIFYQSTDVRSTCVSVRAKALLQRVPLRRTVEFPAQRPAGQKLGAAAGAAQPVGAVPRKKPMGLGWWSYGGNMMGKP